MLDVQAIRTRAAVYNGRCSTQDVMDLCDEIEALRRQNRELVTEIKIRDGVISDLQNRLAAYQPSEAWSEEKP